MKRNTEPTCTHRVEQALRQQDDFMSVKQIMAATGCSNNQVTASIHHLQKYKAVDSVSNHDTLYWFLTGEDLRTKHVEAKAKEVKPRRSRRGSKPPSTTLTLSVPSLTKD